MITTLDIAEIEEAITDCKLLQRAFVDTVEAAGMYAIVGRSTRDAIRALDDLRRLLEARRP